MHQGAPAARLGQRLDPGKLDGVFVIAVRARLVVDVVEHDFHARAATLRVVQRLEHRRPLEFIERALQAEFLTFGALDEGDDALDQAARQPVIRALTDFVRRAIQEPARIFLRCGGSTIEVDGVIVGDALGRHRHAHRGALLHRSGLAGHRDDGVRVRVARLGAVVGPLKRLKRMLEARKLLARGGMGLDAGERLHPFHPEGFTLGFVLALDRETAKAGSKWIVDIQPQHYHVGSRDGVHC